MENQLIEDFEWLHRHPELSYEEVDTTAYILASLQESGVRILPVGLKTGVVAQIDGAQPGPCIALRADIDALPITEESGLCYASQHAGKMHACGHDFHTAVLLDAARRIMADRVELKGSVRLFFQPAEEGSYGALKITENAAAMDGVCAIFALHASPCFESGAFALRPGAASASVDRFAVTIHGKGTHAAAPHMGIDPLVVAAEFVLAAQTIVSRNVSPVNAALVSITHLESGKSWNVISDTAFMEGTVRTLDPEDRAMIPQRLKAIAYGIAQAHGATAEFDWESGPPATNNDPSWVRFAEQTAQKYGFPTQIDPPNMLGEDFSFFQQKVPGVYIHVGVGLTAPLHNARFIVDEAALAPAAAYLAHLAQDAAASLQKSEEGMS